MKNYFAIYTYGAIIILAGLFLLFSENSAFSVVRLTAGIALTIGALFAFLSAMSRMKKQVQFAYHEMHSMAILAYGLSLVLFCSNFEQFMSFTTFLFIFYAVSEITFCTWLFNLKQRTVHKIVIIRLLLGLVIGLGTVVTMNFTDHVLFIFGTFFILSGINIMLYVPVIKRSHIDHHSKGEK